MNMQEQIQTSGSTRSTAEAARSHAPRPASGVRPVSKPSAAELMAPVIEGLVGPVPVRVEFWDGSVLGPTGGDTALLVRSPNALRRMVWAPGELGLARAFVTGEIDAVGDLFEVIKALRPAGVKLHNAKRVGPAAVAAVYRLGLLGRPLPPPSEEAPNRRHQHVKHHDAASISHHYDVGNEFYRLVLGEAMTYSCARFVDASTTLEEAQAAKHELICRKLGLHERSGMRLLDVGCGWGSTAMHAAREHGARVVGVTISEEQAKEARRRVDAAGLGELIEIRLQDYRDLSGERFDAIASIGMFEHVGKNRMAEYFNVLRCLLGPHGRLLNHAISSVGGSRLSPTSFAYRYVVPDGELIDIGDTAIAMQAAGFEVRDVESLREHYAMTLRHWVANLREHWDTAVALVGEPRARVWLLYMTASAVGFEDAGLNIHQTLGIVRNVDDGSSGMPRTRREWN